MIFHKGKADGLGYSSSSLTAARSTISAVAKIFGVTAGQHDLVCLFMRSVAQQQSQFPKLTIHGILILL